eukprot:COSAG06_NODE_1281_length_10018_cov_15.949894_8_plen_248_part_00
MPDEPSLKRRCTRPPRRFPWCDGNFRCPRCPNGMGPNGRGFTRARNVPCSDPDAHLTISDRDNCSEIWSFDFNQVHFDLPVGRELNRSTGDVAKPSGDGWCIACDPHDIYINGRMQPPRAKFRVRNRAKFRVRNRAKFRVRNRAKFRVRNRAKFRVRNRAKFRVRNRAKFRARNRAKFRVRNRAKFRVRNRACEIARAKLRETFAWRKPDTLLNFAQTGHSTGCAEFGHFIGFFRPSIRLSAAPDTL